MRKISKWNAKLPHQLSSVNRDQDLISIALAKRYLPPSLLILCLSWESCGTPFFLEVYSINIKQTIVLRIISWWYQLIK